VSKELSLRNRQRARKIDLRLLRRVILNCLEDLLDVKRFDLGIRLVNSKEMMRINEGYLGHRGSTDVITFDYADAPGRVSRASLRRPKSGTAHCIHGDIYVCVDEAFLQAKQFDVSWQEELVRYIIHGILHLLGYDDHTRRLRQPMKRMEEKLMAELVPSFPLRSLQIRNARRNG
jgi:rRNA maturation RNase YbeY